MLCKILRTVLLKCLLSCRHYYLSHTSLQSCSGNLQPGTAVHQSFLVDFKIILFFTWLCGFWFSNVENISYFLLRNALVQQESVNSVVVDDAPEDPFQQLLVAASVAASRTGNA